MKGKSAWKPSKAGAFPKVKQGMWDASKKNVKGAGWKKAKSLVTGPKKTLKPGGRKAQWK